MSTLQITVSDVSLTSSWFVRSQPSGGTYCTTPLVVTCSRTFDLSSLPAGSTIHSATLDAVRHGPNGVNRCMDGRSGVNPLSVAPERIVPGEALTIGFQFQANAVNDGQTGYHCETARWQQITLTVEYTGFTACKAPTAVYLSQETAPPEGEAILSWSGAQAGMNTAIAGYAVYRASGPDGPYTLLLTTGPNALSCTVTSPSQPGCYHFRVKALSDPTGYDSALSAVSVALAVNATPPGKPGSVAVMPQRQYPEGEATLTWTAAEGGENNPVTGYAVYAAAAPEGPYQFLASAQGLTCAVTAPQSGVRYLKVLAVGECLQGPLSDSAAALTADLSGTSDFDVSGEQVDAGTALTLTPLSNLDKAHTLTVSIGAFSDTVEAAAGAASISFTPPLAWLAAMPSTDAAPMTLRLQTAGAGTVIHTVMLRCPDTVVPTGMGGSAAPLSEVIPAAWGVLVDGFSAARITFHTPGQAPYGASITSYRLEGPSVSLEGDALPLQADTPILTGGEKQYVLSATDSRGRTGRQTLTLTVYPYEAPTLSGLLSLRADASGVEDDEGTYIRCTAQLLHASCGGHNTVRCAVAYRRQGETAWQSAGEMTAGALLFGGGLIALPINWEIRCTVTDDLNGENVYYDVVTRAVWEMHVKRGGGAWAFGGVADADGALKVYGDVIARHVTALASPLALEHHGVWTPVKLSGSAAGLTFSSGAWASAGRIAVAVCAWTSASAQNGVDCVLEGLPFTWDGAASGQIVNCGTGKSGAACGVDGEDQIRFWLASGQAAPTAANQSGLITVVGLMEETA